MKGEEGALVTSRPPAGEQAFQATILTWKLLEIKEEDQKSSGHGGTSLHITSHHNTKHIQVQYI